MAGIYLHIPFCRQACTYCDFHFTTRLGQREAFVEALVKEIALEGGYFAPGTEIASVYFGGGTPSLLTPEQLAQIMEALHRTFTLVPNAEVTLEANPDDFSAVALTEWKHVGINRLSVGIQSFREADLRFMHRAHSAEQALRCVPMAQDAGFSNLTLDLIYAVPGLTDADWTLNLETALGLGAPHLSAYALTVEDRTALAKAIATGRAPAPSDAAFETHFALLQQYTAAAGMEQYEVSNFAWPGYRAVHNSSYWTGAPYLGLGPSAHGFDGLLRRYRNVPGVAAYTERLLAGALPERETEELSLTDRLNEVVLTRLRLKDGLLLAALPEALRDYWHTEQQRELALLEQQGLLEQPTPGHWRIPQHHLGLADGIAARLML